MFSPAVPPACHKQRSLAVSSGQSGANPRGPLGGAHGSDLGGEEGENCMVCKSSRRMRRPGAEWHRSAVTGGTSLRELTHQGKGGQVCHREGNHDVASVCDGRAGGSAASRPACRGQPCAAGWPDPASGSRRFRARSVHQRGTDRCPPGPCDGRPRRLRTRHLPGLVDASSQVDQQTADAGMLVGGVPAAAVVAFRLGGLLQGDGCRPAPPPPRGNPPGRGCRTSRARSPRRCGRVNSLTRVRMRRADAWGSTGSRQAQPSSYAPAFDTSTPAAVSTTHAGPG